MLHARLEPAGDARLAKQLRAALQRRHAVPHGAWFRVRRAEAWHLVVTNPEDVPVTGVRLRSTEAAEDGQWLVHDLDEDARIAWGFRFTALPDVIGDNDFPAELAAGDSARVVLATWLADFAKHELRSPTLDLELAWVRGTLPYVGTAELAPSAAAWEAACRPGTMRRPRYRGGA